MNYNQSPKKPGRKGFETLSFAKRKEKSRRRRDLAKQQRKKNR